jgi:hypothetical protein
MGKLPVDRTLGTRHSILVVTPTYQEDRRLGTTTATMVMEVMVKVRHLAVVIRVKVRHLAGMMEITINQRAEVVKEVMKITETVMTVRHLAVVIRVKVRHMAVVIIRVKVRHLAVVIKFKLLTVVKNMKIMAITIPPAEIANVQRHAKHLAVVTHWMEQILFRLLLSLRYHRQSLPYHRQGLPYHRQRLFQ